MTQKITKNIKLYLGAFLIIVALALVISIYISADVKTKTTDCYDRHNNKIIGQTCQSKGYHINGLSDIEMSLLEIAPPLLFLIGFFLILLVMIDNTLND